MMRNFHVIKQNGFTLIELLVAITVFAVMTFMAYGGLSYVISNSQASGKALERLHEVQIAMFTIERDLSQLTRRDIRDEFGQKNNYIRSGANFDYIIEFTRNGRRNPAKLLRSHLVRVAYKLNEGKLIRLYWPHLDRVQGVTPDETVLLTKTDSVELRFLDNKNKWHSQWPPVNTSSTETVTLNAIEYNITLSDWGTISRLIKTST